MKVTAIEECNIAQNNQAIELNLLDPLYSNYSDILALLDKTEIMPRLKILMVFFISHTWMK